jgi:T3SS (YopN, CesT) and YbjN peptide-binding chaperone 1
MVFSSDGGVGKAKKMVEGAVRERGMDPDKHQAAAAKGGFAWALRFGSAAVMIALNPGVDKDAGRLRVVSPIVKMPKEPSAKMLRRLLELNGTELPGVALGIVGDEVVLVAERSISGLDRSEVEEILSMAGFYADKYDDMLVSEFGGVRVCDID